MAAELSFSDTSDVATTDLGISSLQRTSVSSTITRRLWNELTITGTASTATNVLIRAGAQMNVGEPYLYDGSVEPIGAQWLTIRQISSVSNPNGGTSQDHQAFSTGWTTIGGPSVFTVNGAIPARFARHFEYYLEAGSTGSSTSINSFRISAESDRGVTTLPTHSKEILGDWAVYRGGWDEYYLLRGKEDAGVAVKENPAGADADTVLVEDLVAHVGRYGVGSVDRHTFTVPTIANDGDAVATGAGEEYTILVTLSDTPTETAGAPGRWTSASVVFTKGSKATTGNSVAPAAPNVNHIPIAEIVKRHAANIVDADITATAVYEANGLTYDGSGRDLDFYKHMTMQSGAVQQRQGRENGTMATDDTYYASRDSQGVLTLSTSQPSAGNTFLGRVVTSGGAVTSFSPRAVHNARSSYAARRRTETSPWLAPDGSDVIQFFGRLDRVQSGALPGNVTHVAGHYIAANCTAFTTEGNLRITGTRLDAGMAETATQTEDSYWNKANDWWLSKHRYGSLTSNNSPDVAFSTPDTLVGTFSCYRAEPWQGNHNAPCHLAALQAEWVPQSDSAALRVRLYKVPITGSGVSTVFDSGLMNDQAGNSSAIAQIPMQAYIHEDATNNTESDTVQWDEIDDLCILQAWAGEWLYAEVSNITDIETVRLTLHYYDWNIA